MKISKQTILLSATIAAISCQSSAMPANTAAFLNKKIEQAKEARNKSQLEIDNLKQGNAYHVSGGMNSGEFSDLEPSAGESALQPAENVDSDAAAGVTKPTGTEAPTKTNTEIKTDTNSTPEESMPPVTVNIN